MRALVVIGSMLVLAGCSGDPKAWGITGPNHRPPASAETAPGADTTNVPGVPANGTYYGPSFGPTQGSSGFWGYNN